MRAGDHGLRRSRSHSGSGGPGGSGGGGLGAGGSGAAGGCRGGRGLAGRARMSGGSSRSIQPTVLGSLLGCRGRRRAGVAEWRSGAGA